MMPPDIGPWAPIPEWVVRELSRAPHGREALALYIELALRVDRRTQAWTTSRTSLAGALGVTVRSITRCAKVLTDLGALDVVVNRTKNGDQGWNTYRVFLALPDRLRGTVEYDPPVVSDLDVRTTEGALPLDSTVPTGGLHSPYRGTSQSLPGDSTVPLEQEPLFKNPSTRTNPKSEPDGSNALDLDAWFEGFWTAYPRKESKPTAKTKFKIACDRDGLDAVQAGARVWCEHWRRERTGKQFIPLPQTWLNQQRYLDEPTPSEPRSRWVSPKERQDELDRERQHAADLAGRPVVTGI